MSQSAEYKVVRERNVMVPMRDGIRLATDVYRPDGPGRFPVLVTRGPYGKDTYADNQEHSIWFFPPTRIRGGQPRLPGTVRIGGRRLRSAVPRVPGRVRHRGVGRPPTVVRRPGRHYRPVLPGGHPIYPGRRRSSASSPPDHGPGVGVVRLSPELGIPHRRRYGVGLDRALRHPQRPQHPGTGGPSRPAGTDGRVCSGGRQFCPSPERLVVPPLADARLDRPAQGDGSLLPRVLR